MKHIFLILISIYISGCDLFTVRDAEAPTSPSAVYQPAVSPEQLFENLKNSFKDKSSQNYRACFVDSAFSSAKFVFQPSSEANAKYPVFTSTWSIKDEEAYFNSLASHLKNGAITLTLSNEEYTPLNSSSSTYVYEYNIAAAVSEDKTIKPSYKGIAQFKIILDARQQWVISEWQDIKMNNVSEPTWSELKGSLY